MFDNWTFGRKVAVGFSIAGIILLLIAASGYESSRRLIANQRLVQHTHEVQATLARLVSAVKDAETSQRGFVITGKEEYLAPYNDAGAEISRATGDLRRLVADNPNQVRRLDALIQLIDDKLSEVKRPLEARRASGFEAAQAIVLTGTGKDAMDKIRTLSDEMDAEEETLLKARNQEAEASAGTATAIILWGSVAGAVLVLLIGWFITRSLTLQIGAAVKHIQSSSTELHAAASQQASGAKEHATGMNQISSTISELLATSRQIASGAQRVSGIAEQTAAAARAGTGTVDRAHESIAAIRRQVDLIVNHMLELGKSSQQIGSVLDIVSELAEQTNILAINATIEAAGAGESGRRFAVVADEIRKLADRVGASTKEVRALIESVRGSVNTTVMATETGSKAVDSGAKQFGEVATSFKQIHGLVSNTTEAAREIELSTKQQSTAVEQVNVAIASIGQASRENEASAGQTLQTALQLTTLSKDLTRLVQAQQSG